MLHGTKAAQYISIKGSNISSNDNNGIEVQNWDNVVSYADANTSLVITDCSFERNRQNGLVTSENSPFALHIENSTFKENSQYGLYFYRYYPNNIGRTVFKISQSYFKENLYEGIYFRSILGGPTHIGIYDSSFKENSRGAMYLDVGSDSGYNETMIDINNNTVLRHSYSNYPCEIYQRSNRFRVTIRNNSFRENRGALYVQGSDGQMKFVIINNKFQSITDVIKSVIKVSNALLEFTNNVIENATAATLIQIGSGYDHLITNNSFISDEDVSCFVNVKSPFKIDKVIEMRNNFWGTNSLQRIKEKICDFFFNIHVVRVQLKSIFVDPTLNVKTYIVPEDAFVQIHANESYVYGGILHNTLQRPQYTNNTIFVNRSIIIESTGEMKFAGSHIIFAENRGIIVKGNRVLCFI